MAQFDRRNLVKAGLSLAMLGGAGAPRLLAKATFTRDPFTLGVASGDPWPDGFVIWTRLAPEPQTPDGGMPPHDVPVRWDIAEDPGFRKIVRTGSAVADATLAHSVHVEVDGLRSHRPYWYRFLVQGAGSSPVGTARTAPAAGASLDRLRLAMLGCQDFETGFFTAYAHVAREPDLDAVFHYGDYIYEMATRAEPSPRKHHGAETYTLDQYRRRYAQYKADPDLQAAHAAVAFIMSFDDHEIDDNWAGEFDKDGNPPPVFAARKAAALQAWYEHVPVRRAQRPGTGRAYRRFDYGTLARMHVLDTRSARSDQLCERPGIARGELDACVPVDRPGRTMLGAAQERWLDDGLANDARWNFIAQQVLFMPYDARKDGATTPVVGKDNWNGYPLARQRLVDGIARRGLTNVVIGSGDLHQNVVGSVPRDANDLGGAAIATEFLATSISSGGTGGARYAGEARALDHNPNVSLLNNQRGYQLFTVTPDRWLAEVKVMDQVDRPGGSISTFAKFVVDPKRPGPQPA
ncbi:alkaline phosphatase D family protein [Sphingomonas sp. STIS6.2]|uniref:alkaline phosphatase D family protein n=1 Tax=Sphingomonas sp. STIS6.2 TaxID=1379700 RepID=UPI0004DB8AFC|nr:alkaline phosphatase D family protein [Sphingomonas sp. STIS6.2]